MSDFSNTIVFVTAPPIDTNDFNRYEIWLSEHNIDEDTLQYPYMLSGLKGFNAHGSWPEELESMNVRLYKDHFAYTDEPLEMVYILTRPELLKTDLQAKIRFNKWLREYTYSHCHSVMGIGDANYLINSNDPIFLGTIEVRDSGDREPLIHEIEQFGKTELVFIDIRNPWVD